MRKNKLFISKIIEWKGTINIETLSYIGGIERFAVVLLLDGEKFYITKHFDAKEQAKTIFEKSIKQGYFDIQDYTKNTLLCFKNKEKVLDYFIENQKVFGVCESLDENGIAFEIGSVPLSFNKRDIVHMTVEGVISFIADLKSIEEAELFKAMSDAYYNSSICPTCKATKCKCIHLNLGGTLH